MALGGRGHGAGVAGVPVRVETHHLRLEEVCLGQVTLLHGAGAGGAELSQEVVERDDQLVHPGLLLCQLVPDRLKQTRASVSGDSRRASYRQFAELGLEINLADGALDIVF